jgi:hypothetical protein
MTSGVEETIVVPGKREGIRPIVDVSYFYRHQGVARPMTEGRVKTANTWATELANNQIRGSKKK